MVSVRTTAPRWFAILDSVSRCVPNQGLSDVEIKHYLAYFHWADQNLQPSGKSSPPATPRPEPKP